MSKFRITSGKGFHLTFNNGITISVQWGKMNYCEKHEITGKNKCVKCTVEKREKTMLERYGVRSALHSTEIKNKKDSTCLKVYGSKNTFENQIRQVSLYKLV